MPWSHLNERDRRNRRERKRERERERGSKRDRKIASERKRERERCEREREREGERDEGEGERELERQKETRERERKSERSHQMWHIEWIMWRLIYQLSIHTLRDTLCVRYTFVCDIHLTRTDENASSSHAHEWVTSRMNESCPVWRNHLPM